MIRPIVATVAALTFYDMAKAVTHGVVIREVRLLEKTGGNKRRAARLLNLSRTTLIDKLQRLEAPKPAEATPPSVTSDR